MTLKVCCMELQQVKFYTVGYDVMPPEDFPKYLQTAQSMIDSFEITSKQCDL